MPTNENLNSSSEMGSMNVLLIPLILVSLLFFAAAGFGGWAYVEMQDYKNNSDQKSRQAAELASRQTASEKDNEFVEKEKEPLVDYKGPADLGSIQLKYPKTWSGYITNDGDSSNFIFHPNVVVGSEEGVYALRVSVIPQAYNDVVEEYSSFVDEGKARAGAYKLPKMKGVTGVRINGEIEEGKQGSVVIMPLRDKTIKIAVESKDFAGDFDKIILPNFSYSP